MTYIFNGIDFSLELPNTIIAHALNGIVYIENSRLHVVNNKIHFICTSEGWYVHNNKTLKDVYIGKDVAPSIDFNDVNILDDTLWNLIQYSEDTSSDSDLINYVSNLKYIPSQEKSIAYFAKSMLKDNTELSSDEKISLSGLYDIWQPGNYSVGDIRNYAGQTWECWTAHDNSIYPDITPDNLQTWANFWRPLHGTSIETARPWTKPVAGTTDMYHVGEYMVYTDGKIYKCLADTVYNPEEYAAAWEIVDVT